MAYQDGPRSTYAGPTNNAPHFPLSHQQQSPFYANPYPQSNGPSPPIPSYAHPHPQPSERQTYQPQRHQYGPNQNQNGRGPLMQPPTSLPDDHFKKPYLPQQQYMNHGPLLFPIAFSSSSLWHEVGIMEWVLLMAWYIPQLNHPQIS